MAKEKLPAAFKMPGIQTDTLKSAITVVAGTRHIYSHRHKRFIQPLQTTVVLFERPVSLG